MLLSQPVATYPHLHYPQQQHAHHPTAQQHHVYAPELAYQNPLLLATGYRPIHLPIPQQHQVSAVAAEQQQLALAQQQAAAAAGGGFAPNPNPRLHHQSLPITHRPRRAPRQQHPPQPNMAYQEGTDEYAELQKLSNTYEPEATVGVCYVDATSAVWKLGLRGSEGRLTRSPSLSVLTMDYYRDRSSVSDNRARPSQANMPMLISSTKRRLRCV